MTATPDAINWEKIRVRATKFVEKWHGETSETAEAQSFWNDFFEIFGRTRRGIAFYEFQARRYEKRQGKLQSTVAGRIDMLWPGVLAVEHKSAGKSLDEGEKQLYVYINDLPDDLKPAFGLVCDFSHFRLINISAKTVHDFRLSDLPSKAELFGFFIEHEKKIFALELQANHDAAELMGDLYDAMKSHGHYKDIDLFLMRVLFCLFADDTGIWEKDLFLSHVEQYTGEDGTMTGAVLAEIFGVLNMCEKNRPHTLSSALAKFPYINGGLFSERIDIVSFDQGMRSVLLEACRFDWKKISPDIFGALFQSVRDVEARRTGGEHYTSEENILKIIRPLFLDNMEKEIRRANGNRAKLQKLHDKIATVCFLDPACGCGNFLIVAYRELRRLEMEILLRLYPNIKTLDIGALCRVNVDQFYGMEIDSFPANIAQTALWMVDHQMNLEISNFFGNYFTRIPLTVSPRIHCINALRTEWTNIVSPEDVSYILGNPPFVGKQYRTKSQREDMAMVFKGADGTGTLDYVASWYMKTARYIQGTDIQCAYVSTNSITQGDQVAPLWGALYGEGAKIRFAYRSFKWSNEESNVAMVSVVIIGFSQYKPKAYHIYEYDSETGQTHKFNAANINAYLYDAADVLVKSSSSPLCQVPKIIFGSMPNDDGNLLLTEEERRTLIESDSRAASFVRPIIGAQEFLSGEKRWCIWLDGAEPSAFRGIAGIKARLKEVEKYRLRSVRSATQQLAQAPHLFGEIRQPASTYIMIPLNSSEYRKYIPIGFVKKRNIVLNSCAMIPGGDLYHFGVMSSAMHMAWMRAVAGRLESRYRYSNKLVYNTFPWPENITAAKRQKIMKCAQEVLDVRKKHSASTLADMYSNMPRDLAAAHRALDIAVDRAYRRQPFTGEGNRIEYLFSEYSRLTAPVIPVPKKRRSSRRKIED